MFASQGQRLRNFVWWPALYSMETLPQSTLYLSNLHSSIRNAAGLQRALYYLFGHFGTILDVVATATPQRLRGQAWIVFDSVSDATNAMRQMQGFPLFKKPIRISFAKSKSKAKSILDGDYVRPDKRKAGGGAAAARSKRKAGAETAAAPVAKKARASDDVEVEAEVGAAVAVVPSDAPPHNILFAQQLPVKMTAAMLKMLFTQYEGLASVQLVADKRCAFLTYGDVVQATAALQGLAGFKVSPSYNLQLSFAAQ